MTNIARETKFKDYFLADLEGHYINVGMELDKPIEILKTESILLYNSICPTELPDKLTDLWFPRTVDDKHRSNLKDKIIDSLRSNKC